MASASAWVGTRAQTNATTMGCDMVRAILKESSGLPSYFGFLRNNVMILSSIRWLSCIYLHDMSAFQKSENDTIYWDYTLFWNEWGLFNSLPWYIKASTCTTRKRKFCQSEKPSRKLHDSHHKNVSWQPTVACINPHESNKATKVLVFRLWWQ